TVLQAGPCVITQKKTNAKEGYESVQVGLVEFVKGSRVTKAMNGHFAKNNVPPVKFMREFPMVQVDTGDKEESAINVGDKVLVDIFQNDKFVDVSGISKGRGFAGVVKRHKFGGGAASHGSMFQIPGSIGSSALPPRATNGRRISVHT